MPLTRARQGRRVGKADVAQDPQARRPAGATQPRTRAGGAGRGSPCSRLCAAVVAAAVLSCASAALAHAQSPGPPAPDTPDIVVTATRTPQAIERTGSAITVITADEIATPIRQDIVDALRRAPGLDVIETGGPGGTTSVRIRGANAGQTLVLIDGVRVNDPAAASGDYDFSMLCRRRDRAHRGAARPAERALRLGRDRRRRQHHHQEGRRAAAQFNVRTEAGSYGTLSSIGSLTGSGGPWSYAFTGAGQRQRRLLPLRLPHSGDRARFPTSSPTASTPRRIGAGRLRRRRRSALRCGALVRRCNARSSTTRRAARFPIRPRRPTAASSRHGRRAAVDTFDGALTHNLHVFANRTDRSFNDVTYRINTLPQNTTSIITDLQRRPHRRRNTRATCRHRRLRLAHLRRQVRARDREHFAAASAADAAAARRRRSSASRQRARCSRCGSLPIGERLILTLGGRIDDVVDVDRFETWRATAAYLIPETGTKLRASAGTGGKAPTLFQLFAPTFGNPVAAVGGKLRLGCRHRPECPQRPRQRFGHRLRERLQQPDRVRQPRDALLQRRARRDVGHRGRRDAECWPGWLRLKAAYTYLRAKDLRDRTDAAAAAGARRRVALAITPTPNG